MLNAPKDYLTTFFMNNELEELHNMYPPLPNELKEKFCLQIEKLKCNSNNELTYLECCLIMCKHYDISEESFDEYITGVLKDSLEMEGKENHVIKGKKQAEFSFDQWA